MIGDTGGSTIGDDGDYIIGTVSIGTGDDFSTGMDGGTIIIGGGEDATIIGMDGSALTLVINEIMYDSGKVDD